MRPALQIVGDVERQGSIEKLRTSLISTSPRLPLIQTKIKGGVAYTLYK